MDTELSKTIADNILVRSVSFIHSEAPQDEKTRPLPYVSLSFGEYESQLSVTEARDLAKSMFLAAAYAEVDATLFAQMLPDKIGFRVNPKESLDAAQKTNKQLKKVRAQRQSLFGGVKPCLGGKTRLPFVEVPIGSIIGKMTTEKAILIAQWLLEAAEAGEYDVLFGRFMVQRVDIDQDAVGFILQDFQLYRHQNRLEETFQSEEANAG